jgi:membrane protein required for colicin V production
MPSYLDLIVLAVIVVSALLAMLRGFTREVMAILSWGAAAAAAIYFYPLLAPKLADAASPIFVAKEALRPYIAGAAIFFVTLILVSIVTIRISDAILDSKIGALDRSLGFLFGLARGLLLCAIAFVFLNWLAPDAVNGTDKSGKKDWLANSKSLPLLKTASAQLLALLPDDPEGLISKLKKAKPGADEAPPQDAEGEPKDAPVTPSPVKPEPPKAKPEAGDKAKLDQIMRGR